MPVYLVVDICLKDEADAKAFGEYAEQTDRLLAEHGARVIAYDPAAQIREGDWVPRTIVVQEYPDMDTVARIQHSDAYAPLMALRHCIADTNVIVWTCRASVPVTVLI